MYVAVLKDFPFLTLTAQPKHSTDVDVSIWQVHVPWVSHTEIPPSPFEKSWLHLL